MTAHDMVWTAPTSGVALYAGTVAYQGDLALLQPWIVAATGNAGVRFGGHLSGTAQLQQTESQIACKTESDIEQLVVAGPSGQPFQDQHVHCVLQCSYQAADDTLKIEQCELASAVASARAGGQIAMSGPADVQLNGDLTYQWDKFNQLLQPFTGSSIQFSGGGTSPISYRGPLSSAQGRPAGAAIHGSESLWLADRAR